MKTYGTATLKNGKWTVKVVPHVMVVLKRVFSGKSKKATAKIILEHKPEVCRDLDWFRQRYPIIVTPENALTETARAHRDAIQSIEDILGERSAPPTFDLAIPAREYQARAAAAYLTRGSLLLADDLGLGKTCTAIASLTDPRTLPAVVVAPTHLQRQWQREIAKFAPKLLTHIIKKGTPYELPRFFDRGPDVLITTYHKLAGWSAVLQKFAKSIIFDEAHELRIPGSAKYAAAKEIADACTFRLGMTATPIFNYGDEIFSLMEIIRPGCLGTKSEFSETWCGGSRGMGETRAVKDPPAFGSFLRDEFIMLRRTRRDVGRELPQVQHIVHTVDVNRAPLDEIKDRASELAQLILGAANQQDRFAAETELDWKLRQAIGIAKAPEVAAFVRMLVENGESVVLCGWHHAVYAIWERELSDLGVAKYTGDETPAAKDAAAKSFVGGDAKVLLLSLRSGAGLDGLQERSSVIVFGELDWSPAVLEQCVGRLNRDGQKSPVLAYYLIADEGADPIMCEVLGLKRDQSTGIVRFGEEREAFDSTGHPVRMLAEKYLAGRSVAVVAAGPGEVG